MLHDPAVRDSIRLRLRRLSADARRRWGKMSVDQMVWHLSQVLKTSLGELPVVVRKPPLPAPIVKFMLFNLPWPHGAPTAPEYQTVDSMAFEAQRTQCLDLIERFTGRNVDEPQWPFWVFGPITGREWSRFHERHLDHHLKQFGG